MALCATIRTAGSALANDSISLAQREEHAGFPAAREARRRAFDQAGIAPSDVDLA